MSSLPAEALSELDQRIYGYEGSLGFHPVRLRNIEYLDGLRDYVGSKGGTILTLTRTQEQGRTWFQESTDFFGRVTDYWGRKPPVKEYGIVLCDPDREHWLRDEEFTSAVMDTFQLKRNSIGRSNHGLLLPPSISLDEEVKMFGMFARRSDFWSCRGYDILIPKNDQE